MVTQVTSQFNELFEGLGSPERSVVGNGGSDGASEASMK